MSDTSRIEWCDSTFNPWIGCTKVGAGCDNCYAEADFDLRKHRAKWGTGNPRSRTSPANWKKPAQWNRQHAEFFDKHGRRRRVFCASLADVFDNEVPLLWRQHLMALVADTPHLDWLFLTKRIGNAARMLADASMHDGRLLTASDDYQPPANLWIGATICNQEEADRDIPKLLTTPAAVRFLSIEPMLGPIRIDDIPDGQYGGIIKPLVGLHWVPTSRGMTVRSGKLNKIDWVILGGESGPHARPMHPDWARSLRDQCAASSVPFLFKQWGEWLRADLVDSETTNAVWRDRTHFEMNDLGLIQRFKPPMPAGPPHFACDHFLRVGKKSAGRLLDGVQHDGYPKAAS